MSRFRSFRAAACAVAILVLLAPTLPASATTVGPPIIDGLAGPLGLAVGRDGSVYVTEAFAGRMTRIKNGNVKVLIDEPGTEIAGVDARGRGRVVYTQTIFDGNAGEEAPPLDGILGRVRPNGKTRQIASLQDFEVANNPDAGATYGLEDPSPECVAQVEPFFPVSYTGIIESHPYAVAMDRGFYVVADAAANAIFKVRNNGTVSTVAVLPAVPQTIDAAAVAGLAEDGIDVSACLGETYLGEAVPTDIEVGPDRHYYVSTLPGFPEVFGSGQIWKIHRRTGATSLVAGGLSGPVDIAVAADGTIYVAELFAFQISTVVGGVVVDSVFADSPGAIEIGPDGTIFATTGVFGPNGALVTITP